MHDLDTTPYTVTVTTDHDEPLTDHDLEQLAELGGAVTADTGRTRSTTAVNVDLHPHEEMHVAGADAVSRVQKIAPGRTLAIEVLTLDEQEHRLAKPAFPTLVGLAEVAEHLGVSRQRASVLQTRQGFPAPVAVLRSGPVWRKNDLSRFAEQWARTPGRPKRAATS